MRRADRLFQLIQILRRSGSVPGSSPGRPVTARALADELEVSTRSVYRDIADLMAQRVPIRGEAGVGYVLERGFDMPSLTLTPIELEAAVLGAQWVAQRGDPVLAAAALDLLAKISSAMPEALRGIIAEPAVITPPRHAPSADLLNMARLRLWIREGRKLRIRYRDNQQQESERTVWPVMVGYTDSGCWLIAWCELRAAFRYFNTAAIVASEFLDDLHGQRLRDLRHRWRRSSEATHGAGSIVTAAPPGRAARG